MRHPPGNDVIAFLYFASKGPKTKMPALIVLTKEYETNVFIFFDLIIFTEEFFLLYITLKPKDFKRLSIVSISFTFGKFLIITGVSNNKVDAKIGNAEFLLPDIFTLPLNLEGPLIKNLSIIRL